MKEISSYRYNVKVEDSGAVFYREGTWVNRDNWMPVTDSELITDLVERISDAEDSVNYYSSEMHELESIPNFLVIYRELVGYGIELSTEVFIHDSHMGGWYYTLSDMEHERCEQCGDSDYNVWNGTMEEIYHKIEGYL